MRKQFLKFFSKKKCDHGMHSFCFSRIFEHFFAL
jgi:hypothetical protein